MLTREEAQQAVLTLIKARQDAGDISILRERTIERPFGWVFFVAGLGSCTAPTGTARRLIIFNKYANQAIESSIRLIEIYETLLAKSQRTVKNWCLTMPSVFQNTSREESKKAGTH